MMRLDKFFAIFSGFCFAVGLYLSTLAYGAEDAHTSDDSNAAEKEGPGPTVVQVPVILAPLAGSNGYLHNYAYVLIELEIPSANDRWSVEDMIPFVKDAFVRELHAQSNITGGDFKKIDYDGVKARLLATVTEVLGDNRVGSIIFRDFAVPGQ